ncbi:MAG: hypothetical protein R6V83_07080 [Candidatus Thorarchaeota archaeon]
MAIFRADHYITAELNQPNLEADGKKVLDALESIPELKDMALVSRKFEGKHWSEISGRIAIPEGSKAFWGMIKKEVTDREPYNLFVRVDVNAEAETIDSAREKVKNWIESEFVPRIKKRVDVQEIRVQRPSEVYMPKLD